MFDFFRDLLKKHTTLLVFAGIFFIILALFDINTKDIKETLNSTNWLSLGIGLVFVFIGVSWEIFVSLGFEFKSNGFKFMKITNDKYSMNINLGGKHIINIIYGKINDFQEYDKKTLVILPANDKFDDKCIEDSDSALGAFVRSLYPNGNDDFKNIIEKELILE
jgi:hypothetical protein